MTLDQYLEQEAQVRSHCHFHDGVWWKRASWGCCQPLYPLQEIVPGAARPNPFKSFIRYEHAIPGGGTPAVRTKTRLMIAGDKLENYDLQSIPDRKRRQAINKAVRCGIKIGRILDLEKHRGDLQEIYVSNAARNQHGLPAQWYVEHEAQWWRNLVREHALPGRDWFGAFSGDKLVAFLYNCLVEDTAVMLVAKGNKAYLVSDPNDLLWHEAILHYRELAACRRIDAGWAIHVPPTIDWRKRSLGFADVEIPVFAHANPLALGVVRGVLRLARPVLDSPRFAANRGWVFRGRVIQRRLDELSRGD